MGLETRLTRSSRDDGVDVVACDQRPVLGGKVVIQAKRYCKTVGVSAVRDRYGTMMNEGANKGILVSTSGYGNDAFNFAKDKPIELIDGARLLYCTCSNRWAPTPGSSCRQNEVTFPRGQRKRPRGLWKVVGLQEARELRRDPRPCARHGKVAALEYVREAAAF